MQPQNWRKCRCRHCNFRALKRIQNKGFKSRVGKEANAMEAQIWLITQREADQIGGDAFTFAGFAVRLQGEANRTAAAHSCDRVVTRAVTAAVVHRAGLCRETGTHSQTNPVEIYTTDTTLAHLFLPTETAYMHTGVTSKKGGEKKHCNSQHSFFRLMAARKRKQTWFLEWYRNKEQSQMQQEIRHRIIKEYRWKIEFLTYLCMYIKMMKRVSMMVSPRSK